jgi:predicted RNA-binding protein with PUA-like domain
MFQANDDPKLDYGYSFHEWFDETPTSEGQPVNDHWCGPEWVKSAPSIARLRDEVAPGDWVFIYQAQPDQAILGLARMASKGYVDKRRRQGNSPTWFDMDWWMKTPALDRARIVATPQLKNMEFLRMRQGTIFRVSPNEAETLLGMMTLTPKQRREVSRAWDAPLVPEFTEGDLSAQSQFPVGSRTAGFQQDSETRVVVERHAVVQAIKYYEAEGWTVKELGKPYDLHCEKGKRVLHVEVKGTTTDGGSVRLTVNEVEDARDREWRSDLFVVADIRLKRSGGKVQAEGGNAFVLQNWAPSDKHLAPKEFLYSVPITGRRSV